MNAPPLRDARPLTWDLFCAVIDNWGDIGVCWRLARQLAEEYGQHVRLWVDRLDQCSQIIAGSKDLSKQAVSGIELRRWSSTEFPHDPGDVVIEAFACELPAATIAAMNRPRPPVWLNLEYLTAESWVEDCHGMQSPHAQLPLTKTFFFPGFTSRTGGLLRESRLTRDQAEWDRPETQLGFWQALNVRPEPNALRISVFCYDNPELNALLECWAAGPEHVELMVTCGAAARQCAEWFGSGPDGPPYWQRGTLRAHALPFLTQPRYDQLLRACDFNFVRGEDSFVRAQWAQQPFVWQIYPQADGAHWPKLDAFLAKFLAGSPESAAMTAFWHAWNGQGSAAAAWPAFRQQMPWLRRKGAEWAHHLDQAGNLADNLVRFVENVRDKQDGKVQ